ncbi:GNAT family N-acetyltransferase [Lysinibacillus sphaericus]
MKLVPMTLNSSYFIDMLNLYRILHGTDPMEMQKQLRRHLGYPGFEGYFAVEGSKLAGFIYGYSSRAGQYYHDLLAMHLKREKIWLKDCMELAELGVHPQYRRAGIAKALTEQLLHDRKESRALLTVRKDNSGAIFFYEKLKWEEISAGFFPNTLYEYIIMGKEM